MASALDARCGDPQSALFLELIAQHIVDWEVLAPYFSLTEVDQMAIKLTSAQHRVQKRAMLSRWIERNGNEATFTKMKEIFLQANYVNLADKLVEILQDEHSQSPHNAVTVFKLFLKDCYSTISPTDSDRQTWPPLANTPYVEPELQLVLDSSPQWKPGRQPSRPIKFNHVFQDKGSPYKILFEGAAGSGKTTLSRNVCQKWEEGKMLDHIDLLIHLTLADPKVWSAQSLDGLIPHPSAEIRKAVANTIIEQSGKRCCFVMDGWEDLPDDMPLYIHDLVYGSKPGIALPLCSFIITSRPIASASLKQRQSFTTIEITGFSSESIDTYATQYLTQKGEDPAVFITALHDNRHARGLCSLPINATILLHLFLTIGIGFPTTQTELFKFFIINVLLRHLVAKQGQKQLHLSKFSSLPENERKLFDQLCRIAHFANFTTRSSAQSNQLLSQEDLEKEGVRNFHETMGLMKVHSRLTCYGYTPYYGFLHSSVQDFLCAVRISQLSPEEQARDFKRIMSIKPMSLVLLFYAGITKLNNGNVCKHLQQIGENPPCFIPEISDSLSKARDSRRLYLTFLHCLYEADRNDLLPCLTSDNNVISFSYYRFSMYNINVVFHSLADIARIIEVWVDFSKCDVNDHMVESAVEILINRARLNYRKFHRCVTIRISMSRNSITHNGVRSLARLMMAEEIKLAGLDISHNFLNQKSSAFEVLKILTECMSSAQMLSLDSCGLTSRHAYHLVLLLRQNMKYLNFCANKLNESVPILVAASRKIQKLNLEETFVTDQFLIQVGAVLQENTCLEELSISYDKTPFQLLCLTPEAVCQFIKLITSPTSRSKLVRLSIPECYMKYVDSNEQVQTALKQFSLRRCCPLEIIMKFSDTLYGIGQEMGERHYDQLEKTPAPEPLLFSSSRPRNELSFTAQKESTPSSSTNKPDLKTASIDVSVAMTDSELLKAATQEILELKKQQKSLQAELAANYQIRKIKEESKTGEYQIQESTKKTSQAPWSAGESLVPVIHNPVSSQKHVTVQASYSDIAPELQGVDLCGETVFEVLADSLPQKLVWDGYGFNLEVPDGALLPGTTASVIIRLILRGHFSFPENSELVSAIFWISSSKNFLKQVAVNIQHCAYISNEVETTQFKFIIAKYSQSPPYTFIERDGLFNADTQYATIYRKKFSFFGLIGYGNVTKQYTVLKFYKHVENSLFDADFRFVVLADLKATIKKYNAEMEGWNPDADNSTHSIKFRDDSISLDIRTHPPLEVDNWRIIPRSTPLKIKKADIDRCEVKTSDAETADEHVAPSCNIRLRWIGSRDLEDKSLLHRVAILGTTEPDSSFTISYYPSLDSTRNRQVTKKKQLGSKLKLTVNVLSKELKYVTEWKQLGLQLFLEPAILDEVESNNSSVADKKSSMLNRWLKSNPKAAWEDVVSALRAMDEECLATSIEERYCGRRQDTTPADEQVTRSGIKKKNSRFRSQSTTSAIHKQNAAKSKTNVESTNQYAARCNKMSSQWICCCLLLSPVVLIIVILLVFTVK